MYIDLLNYLGKWPYWETPYSDEQGDGLIKLMDRFKIEKSIVISSKAIMYDDVSGNENTFLASDKYNERLLPAITINITRQDNSQEYFEKCIDKGAKMLSLYPYYHGYKLEKENKELENLLIKASDYNCPIYIPFRLIMNWGLYFLPVDNVINFIKQHPKNTFIVDCFNYGEINTILHFASKENNVYWGSSCLTVMDGIENIVNCMGSEKILCGTGAPYQYPGCGLVKIEKADISKEDKNNIFKKNATCLFNL